MGQDTRLDPEPGLKRDPCADYLAAIPRWIGLLPYEAFRNIERPNVTQGPERRATPLIVGPYWLRYGAVAVVDDRVRVIGDDAESVRSLARRLSEIGAPPANQSFQLQRQPDDETAHLNRIRRALEHIRSGDVYQVNLARRFDFQVKGLALNWLQALGKHAPAPFGFALQTDCLRVAGTSPELCLALSPDGGLVTRPIKGTRPRGLSQQEDSQIADSLASDPKELAELSMVIDLERNDLSRVSQVGSVSVIHPGVVETYGLVHHRVATLKASLRPGVDRTRLLEAFLPSGSVTGAPKVRAMELIAALEPARRGLYTGAYGWLGHDGSMRLAMAIRTLIANEHNEGHYFAGGGIVADSDPNLEVEETQWKARQILDFSTKPSNASNWGASLSHPRHRPIENWAPSFGRSRLT
jgi:anthranilate/para-aminobenzoate synthase component I